MAFSWLFRGPHFGQILRVLALEESSGHYERDESLESLNLQIRYNLSGKDRSGGSLESLESLLRGRILYTPTHPPLQIPF